MSKSESFFRFTPAEGVPPFSRRCYLTVQLRSSLYTSCVSLPGALRHPIQAPLVLLSLTPRWIHSSTPFTAGTRTKMKNERGLTRRWLVLALSPVISGFSRFRLFFSFYGDVLEIGWMSVKVVRLMVNPFEPMYTHCVYLSRGITYTFM